MTLERGKIAGGGTVHGDIGYVSLWVPDIERAARFFEWVLGWSYAASAGERSRQVVGTAPHHGLLGGVQRSTLFMGFSVGDIDAALRRVREAGGNGREIREEPFGLVADCVDNQGAAFALFESPASRDQVRLPATGVRHGDVAYITMEVLDSVLARAFYGRVLDWRFGPGSVPDGWGVDDVVPMVGMVGHQSQTTTVPMYRVDDITSCVEKVRAAGGTATDPDREPYGVSSSCTDDQGTRFWLAQMTSGVASSAG